MPAPPQIRRPIRWLLKEIWPDTVGLTARVRSWDGRTHTAIDLQRFYIAACRAYVEHREGVAQTKSDGAKRTRCCAAGKRR